MISGLLLSQNLSKVPLHPASIKYLKLGHPWITEDSFTKRFPQKDFFLIGIDEKNRQEIALLINDHEHKNVKARLWSLNKDEWRNGLNFQEDLVQRISNALAKRSSLKLLTERENVYLINAESDLLPGLQVAIFKDQLLIQYYALFWKKIEPEVLPILFQQIKIHFPELNIQDTWIQERNFNQDKKIRSLNGSIQKDFIMVEFGLNYHLRFNDYYDIGIYTDMSAIRKQMTPYLQKGNSLLNLFCYTGAFSLYGLSLGLENVVSVDLSPKYLTWLDENLSHNPSLDRTHHTSICLSCEKALVKLIADKNEFDSIICDPPSASSDGQSTSSAFKAYEKLLPMLLEVLSSKGTLLVFLNTHTISWNKFEEKLNQIISTTKYANQVNIGKRFKLQEDCSPLKNFHEGDYLKGFLIDFKNSIKR